MLGMKCTPKVGHKELGMKRKYSFSDRLRLVKKIISGYPIRQLCRETGIAYVSLRDWLDVYELLGSDGLRSMSRKKLVSSSEKERMCRLFLEKGVPLRHIYIPNGVSRTALKSWIRKARTDGYGVLHGNGRSDNRCSEMVQSENEILRQELRKAQEENLRLRAENALLKKAKALMEEQESRLRGSGLKSSRR